MPITNNVSTNHPAMEKVSQDLLNTPQRYSVSPNVVDKTPDKDTVQISNKKDIAKKAGIGTAIIAAGVGIFCLLRGRKPSKVVTNALHEAAEQGAKEAKAKAAKEAAERAAKEAETKAAEAKKLEETQKTAEIQKIKEAEKAERDRKYVAARNWGVQYADEHMDELDKLFLDKDGKFIVKECDTDKPYNFYDLITPYDGNLGEIYHGTSPDVKSKILQEGFRQDVPIAHGNLDGVGGTYFTLDNNTDDYGSSVITAKFNGKIGVLDTETIEYIFKPAMSLKTGPFPKWKKDADLEDAKTIREHVIIRYMQNKLKEMGYQGILSDGYSAAASCQYFSALDPHLIEIVK